MHVESYILLGVLLAEKEGEREIGTRDVKWSVERGGGGGAIENWRILQSDRFVIRAEDEGDQ